MVEIIYMNHSWSMLSTSSLKLSRAIKYKFSIPYKNAFFIKRNNPGFSGKYDFINKKSIFPNGVLTRLVNYLKVNKIAYKITDMNGIRKRLLPKDHQLDFKLLHDNPGGITLYDYQQVSVYRALYYTRGLINLATNAGKTDVIASIIKNINMLDSDLNFIVIVNGIQLLHQTAKRISMELGTECNVYHAKNRVLKQLNITTVQTLYSENKGGSKAHFKQIDCFIVDEIHVISGSNKWYNLMQNMFVNAKFRFGTTGTTKVDDAVKEMMFESLTGTVIHRITNQDLISRGQSVKPTVHFWPIEITSVTDAMTYAEEVKAVFRSSNFLVTFINKFKQIDTGGNLILVSNKDHGKVLQKYLPEAIFLSGVDKIDKRNRTLEEWGQGKYKTIIATQIFRFGLDTHHIQKLFILSLGGKTSKVLQEIGRGLRKNKTNRVDIYFMRFLGTNHLIKFASTQKRLCKLEGFDIVED